MHAHTYWPPVNAFHGFDGEFSSYLALPPSEQAAFIRTLSDTRPQDAEKTLNRLLGTVSAYLYGYRDSPLHLQVDRDAELAMQRAKLALEGDLLGLYTPNDTEIPDIRSRDEFVEHLVRLVEDNPGREHPLFSYIEVDAHKKGLLTFLLNEVIRNEVFDDEMALLTVGLPGKMKAVAAENLWDEVGRGKLHNFHTSWLQNLLDAEDAWETLRNYRGRPERWRFLISTNLMNAFLSRPGLKYRAYGATIVLESVVEPHFRRIIAGMGRVGLYNRATQSYFRNHIAIDPRHTADLIDAVAQQAPTLSHTALGEIVIGAMSAVKGICRQYDLTLEYLRGLGREYPLPL